MDMRQAFYQIKILQGAMFVGVVLFAGLSFVFHNVMDIGDSLSMMPDGALYPIVLSAASLLLVSRVIYKSRISKIESGLSLEERVGIFRSAVVLRAVIIEAAALAVIAGYLLSGDIRYLLLAFVPLYFFMSTFPKDEMIYEAMDLSYSEIQRLG